MKISEKGIELIVFFEGLRTKAYRCPTGVWTIGVGHTGRVDGKLICEGFEITEQKAKQLLRDDVCLIERYLLSQSFAIRLRQEQFDSLVSFVFNIGKGAFETSTMRKKLCKGENDSSIAREFTKWVYGTNPISGKKEVLPGLVKRRKKEMEMFLNDCES